MMQAQSSEPVEPKNTKIIDGKFVVDMSQCLGGGSYSKVYVAWLKSNPTQRCACKLISKQQLDLQKKQCDEQRKLQLKTYIKQRIKTEVEIGHKIVHPNIVRFLYFSETTRNIYIFMELCQTNLEEVVKTRGRLTEEEALPFFKHVVEAGCVLYDRNITHRDIKAQNILIKDGVAKLADFGFAKELREKDVQEDGTGVGTILYMAPQLIFEQKPVYSIRCDVWSIGVVMYYALYGKVPWETNQNLQSFQLSLRKPIEFDPSVQLSSRIKNLISRMLIFKDEDRISIKQAREMLQDMVAE